MFERHKKPMMKIRNRAVRAGAVFGVALNDAKEGEGWWVKTIGTDNIAALPYEIYVVNNKVSHLFARFRIALGWPNVGMGSFMRIVEAPGIIRDTLTVVAGGAPGRGLCRKLAEKPLLEGLFQWRAGSGRVRPFAFCFRPAVSARRLRRASRP